MSSQDTFSQITTGINGTGLHDILMQTVKAHLQQEYDAQRIRGADWAKVYLGALEAVLANTVSYLVQSALIPEQKLKIEADIDLVRAETKKVDYEVSQILPAQKLLLNEQIIKTTADTLLVQAQKLSVDQDVLVKKAQITQVGAETTRISSDTLRIQAETKKGNYEADYLYPGQLSKVHSEAALLNAKIGSEILQPGLVQAQIQLLNQQIKGYTWDAAYKSYKITADSWSVARTSNPDLTGAPSSYLGSSFAYY